jgi:translation initiation factor IF-2
VAGKPRVHEIAAEYGVESKQVIEKLGSIGEFVKSSASTIEPPVARKLREALEKDGLTRQDVSAAPAKTPAKSRSTAHIDLPTLPTVEEAAAQAGKPPAPVMPSDPSDPDAPVATAPPRPGGNNPFQTAPAMPRPPRPGNNPFMSPGAQRPTVDRPGGPGARTGGPGRPNAPFQSRTGAPGSRPGGFQRPGGAPGTGGPGGGPGTGGPGRPGGGPSGSRGRGGNTAGAFGKGGGKSKARKSKRTKRQEFEMREAPSLGGVKIPRGDGQTVIRLRQGRRFRTSPTRSRSCGAIPVPPGNLVTVLFQLGEMATATESLDGATFEVLGAELGYKHRDRQP